MVTSVPSQEQWKKEQVYQEAYEKDAQQISLLPIESSQRELLNYKIFPKPQDTSWAIFRQFGDEYRLAIEDLLTSINAKASPTQSAINKSLGAKSRTRSTSIDSELRDAIHEEIAKTISVYANPTNFSGYNFWENYEFPGIDQAVIDCWYWQLAYWIMEDVVNSVGAINYGSNSVFTSPVKRIMNIDFESAGGLRSIGLLGSRSKSASSPPRYVTSVENMFTQSFTGKISNQEIDVIHFNVSVIINNNSIPRFIQELCSSKQHTFRGFSGTDQEQRLKHNQITVLEMQISPVEQEAQEHQRYRYGNDPVVKLDLICEYLFVKAGYEPIFPDAIKNAKAAGTQVRPKK
jgi:hypothetical protein